MGLHHKRLLVGNNDPRLFLDACFVCVEQEEYDMVVDARFSTLQLAIDKECVVTSTPFFK